MTRITHNLTKLVATLVLIIGIAYALLIIFPSTPFFLNHYLQQPISANLYLLQMILAAILGLFYYQELLRFARSILFKWLAFVMAVLGLNIIRLVYFSDDVTSIDISDAIDRFQQCLLLPAVSFIAFISTRKQQDKWVFLAYIVTVVSVIVSFFYPGLLSFQNAALINSGDVGRASGFIGNANSAAETVILGLLLLVGRVNRKLFLLLYSVALVAVFLTLSRSGIIAIVLLGAVFITQNKISRWYLVVPVIVMLSYSVILEQIEIFVESRVEGQIATDILMDRFDIGGSIRGEESTADGSTEERKKLAIDTFFASLKRPFLGYGIESKSIFSINSHNFFLEVWFQYGIFGIAIWLWTCFMLYKSHPPGRLRWANVHLVYFVFLTPFNHLQLYSPQWWVYLSIVFGTSLYVRGNKPVVSQHKADSRVNRFPSQANPDSFSNKRKKHRRKKRSSSTKYRF